jgi:hypothetical protein
LATATISTPGMRRSPGMCVEPTMPPAPMIPTRIVSRAAAPAGTMFAQLRG